MEGVNAGGSAGRKRRHRQPRFHLCRRHREGPHRLRRSRAAGPGLQPRFRRRDRNSRSRPADQRAGGQSDADRADAAARLGPFRASLRRPDKGAGAAGLRGRDGALRRAGADDRLDPGQSRHDPPLHADARPLPAGAARSGRMTRFRLLTTVGARPQFVKAAAISRAVASRDDVEEVLLHTGQHFDATMSQVFFDELGIAAPQVNLGIHGGSHGAMTGQMLAGIEEVILAERPALVLVAGDTNSTLAGALAAAKLQVPVAHLEAGLRSFNRAMPEEINRVLTDHVSALLLCPTDTAIANLHAEGIVDGVHDIGDVMYDSTLFAAAQAQNSPVLDGLGLVGRPYAVATGHRAERPDDPERVAEALGFLRRRARQRAGVRPPHPPGHQLAGRVHLELRPRLACDPLGYLDMHPPLQLAAPHYTPFGRGQKEGHLPP